MNSDQFVQNLLVERSAHIEGVKIVLKPLILVAAITVFALCFWHFELGLLVSIGAAILTIPVFAAGISIPVGYMLGARTGRRWAHQVLAETEAALKAAHDNNHDIPLAKPLDELESDDAFADQRAPARVRRNEPCPCGSGVRYKHCHGRYE
jgi:hypothetical protein